MRAAVLEAVGKMPLREVPTPEAGPGEVVTHEIPLSEMDRALAVTGTPERIKVVVRPDQ